MLCRLAVQPASWAPALLRLSPHCSLGEAFVLLAHFRISQPHMSWMVSVGLRASGGVRLSAARAAALLSSGCGAPAETGLGPRTLALERTEVWRLCPHRRGCPWLSTMWEGFCETSLS